MDDVASASGVTKATLYKHFTSKDELISACLSDVDLRHFTWFVAQADRYSAEGDRPLDPVFTALDR